MRAETFIHTKQSGFSNQAYRMTSAIELLSPVLRFDAQNPLAGARG